MLLFLLRSLESTQLSQSTLISALTIIPQLFPRFLPSSETLATWAPRLPHQAEPKALQRVTLPTHLQFNSGSLQARQPCLPAKWAWLELTCISCSGLWVLDQILQASELCLPCLRNSHEPPRTGTRSYISLLFSVSPPPKTEYLCVCTDDIDNGDNDILLQVT